MSTQEDDLFKGLKAQNFPLDSSVLLVHFLRQLEIQHSFQAAIIKNQVRIMEYLKSGEFDEATVTDIFNCEIDRLIDQARENCLETIAQLASDSGPSESKQSG